MSFRKASEKNMLKLVSPWNLKKYDFTREGLQQSPYPPFTTKRNKYLERHTQFGATINQMLFWRWRKNTTNETRFSKTFHRTYLKMGPKWMGQELPFLCFFSPRRPLGYGAHTTWLSSFWKSSCLGPLGFCGAWFNVLPMICRKIFDRCGQARWRGWAQPPR